MTTALRIDFVALRAELKIAEVLRLLDCEMSSQRGSQWRGACPLHGVALGTARCFSVNVERQCFYCFKCGRSGNALDLWCAATNQTPYDAALDLCRRLNVPVPYMKYGELHTSVHLRSRRQHREIGYRVLKNVDFLDILRKRKTTQVFAWFMVIPAEGTGLEPAAGYPASHFQ